MIYKKDWGEIGSTVRARIANDQLLFDEHVVNLDSNQRMRRKLEKLRLITPLFERLLTGYPARIGIRKDRNSIKHGLKGVHAIGLKSHKISLLFEPSLRLSDRDVYRVADAVVRFNPEGVLVTAEAQEVVMKWSRLSKRTQRMAQALWNFDEDVLCADDNEDMHKLSGTSWGQLADLLTGMDMTFRSSLYASRKKPEMSFSLLGASAKVSQGFMHHFPVLRPAPVPDAEPNVTLSALYTINVRLTLNPVKMLFTIPGSFEHVWTARTELSFGNGKKSTAS